MELQEHEYYQVGKRLLYWDGEKWMKPVKNLQGRYSYLQDTNQPVKSVEPIHIADPDRWVKP